MNRNNQEELKGILEMFGLDNSYLNNKGVIKALEEMTDSDFSKETIIDGEEAITNDVIINLIKNLNNDTKEIIDLIAYLLKIGGDNALITLLQNKLLYFGYEEAEMIKIPESLRLKDLIDNIIKYFCYINFMESTDDTISRIKNLKSIMNTYGLYK